jgi:shikimate kinase
VVLIGPEGAGKSTVGRLIAERLGVPWVEMDAVCRRYYEEDGYDAEMA